MIRRRLGTLLATLVLGIAGGTVAATPAQAGTFTCNARYFFKAASTQRYLSIVPDNGWLLADRAHKGWWEQFQECRDSSWNAKFFVLRSDALGSEKGGASYLQRTGDHFQASRHTLTGNDLFEWRGSSTYGRLMHAETGRYLTVDSDGVMPYLGLSTTAPDQALYRES